MRVRCAFWVCGHHSGCRGPIVMIQRLCYIRIASPKSVPKFRVLWSSHCDTRGMSLWHHWDFVPQLRCKPANTCISRPVGFRFWWFKYCNTLEITVGINLYKNWCLKSSHCDTKMTAMWPKSQKNEKTAHLPCLWKAEEMKWTLCLKQDLFQSA